MTHREGLAAPDPTSKGGFFTGIGFLVRGVGMYARSPRLMLLGLVPALISFLALVAAFVAMVVFVDDVVVWLTPYANDWSSAARDTMRLVAMLGIGVVWVVLSVVAYVAVTLLIGQPFYEAISKQVEDRLGGVPGEINVSFWKSLPRTVIDSIRLPWSPPSSASAVSDRLIPLGEVTHRFSGRCWVVGVALGSPACRLSAGACAIATASAPFASTGRWLSASGWRRSYRS